MNDKEYKRAIKVMRKKGKEIASSKEKSIAFLQEIGLLNKKGKVKKKYRDIVTPISTR